MKDGWYYDGQGVLVSDQLWTMEWQPKSIPKSVMSQEEKQRREETKRAKRPTKLRKTANDKVQEKERKCIWEGDAANWEWRKTPRGIKDILTKRGLWTDNLKLQCTKPAGVKTSEHACKGKTDCCARTMLANQPDFLEQECEIASVIREAGHLCLFLPKYHCKLNIIEFLWGSTKRWTRENCDSTFEGLQTRVPEGQGRVKVETIKRWYHRMMRWVEAYESGANAPEAQAIVLKFSEKRKHHRRIGDNDKLT